MNNWDKSLLENKTRIQKIETLQICREELFTKYANTAKEWFEAFSELQLLYKGVADIHTREAYSYVIKNVNWFASDYHYYIKNLPITPSYNDLRQIAVSNLEKLLPVAQSFEAYLIYTDLVNSKIKGLDISRLDFARTFNPEKDTTIWLPKRINLILVLAPRFHKIWIETRANVSVSNASSVGLFASVAYRFMADYDSEYEVKKLVAETSNGLMDAFRRASTNDINVLDKNRNLLGKFTREESDFSYAFKAKALSRAIIYSYSLFNQVGFWSAYHAIIRHSDFMSSTELQRVELAIQHYKKQQYGPACFYLLTTIEASLSRNLNMPVVASAEGNLFDTLQLGNLLTALTTKTNEVELVAYLRNILVSKKGLNLRNRILHGLDFEIENSQSVALLFHVVFLLSIAQKTETGDYIFHLRKNSTSRIDDIIHQSEPHGDI